MPQKNDLMKQTVLGTLKRAAAAIIVPVILAVVIPLIFDIPKAMIYILVIISGSGLAISAVMYFLTHYQSAKSGEQTAEVITSEIKEKKPLNKWIVKIGAAVVVTVMFALAMFKLSATYFAYAKYERDFVPVDATVNMMTSIDTDEDSNNRYMVKFSYKYENVDYTASDFTPQHYEKGDSVPILVDPNEPEKAVIKWSDAVIAEVKMITMIIGGFWLAAMVLILLSD